MARVIIAVLLVALLAAQINCGYLSHRECTYPGGQVKQDFISVSKRDGCVSRGDGSFEKIAIAGEGYAAWTICADSQCSLKCEIFTMYPLNRCFDAPISSPGYSYGDSGYYTYSDSPFNDDQLMQYQSYEKSWDPKYTTTYYLTALNGVPRVYYGGRYSEVYTCNREDGTVTRTVSENDQVVYGPITTPRTDCNVGYDAEEYKNLCMRCF